MRGGAEGVGEIETDEFGRSSENRPVNISHVTLGTKERQLESGHSLATEPNFHGGIMNIAFSLKPRTRLSPDLPPDRRLGTSLW